MTHMVVKNAERIKSASEAIRYCVVECPLRGSLGCAVDCELRKRFHIPPHGDKYPDTESFKLKRESCL